MHAHSFYQPLTGTDPAAIAIVRMVGAAVPSICDQILRFHRPMDWCKVPAGSVRRADLVDPQIGPIDDIVVSFASRCGAECGEGTWEIWLHLHGGPGILRRCCELLDTSGLNRISSALETPFSTADRIECASLSRLPDMKTQAGVRWLLSQPERVNRLLTRLRKRSLNQPNLVRRACKIVLQSLEIVEWFARPLRIALIGPPNAGKSTLMNALAGAPVSMTSEIAGTTRDWIEAPGEIAGFPVLWIDTAGMHETDDPLDLAGMVGSQAVAANAGLRLGVFDIARPEIGPTGSGHDWPNFDVVVFNKRDLRPDLEIPELELMIKRRNIVCLTSAINGDGINTVRCAILRAMNRDLRKLHRATAFSPLVVREFSHLAGIEAP